MDVRHLLDADEPVAASLLRNGLHLLSLVFLQGDDLLALCSTPYCCFNDTDLPVLRSTSASRILNRALWNACQRIRILASDQTRNLSPFRPSYRPLCVFLCPILSCVAALHDIRNLMQSTQCFLSASLVPSHEPTLKLFLDPLVVSDQLRPASPELWRQFGRHGGY